MFNFLYSVCTTILSVIAVPFFFLSARGRARFWERFGGWNLRDDNLIWFHGASVGEINGLVPLVRAVHDKYPAAKILVTATSSNAFERLPDFVAHRRLLPFDSPIWIARALRGVRVKCFIFSENEIWPALLRRLRAGDVPCYFVNARISDFSWPRYKRLGFFIRPVLNSLNAILAVNAKARDRFSELGVDASRISVAGNSKYDHPPQLTGAGEIAAFRATFFNGSEPVLVLGSVRPGEEAAWFGAFTSDPGWASRLRVIVAPRHLERVQYFSDALAKYGIKFTRRTQMSGASEAGVVLLDTMGELNRAYSFAAMVFIGATLVDLGGHNPLEAAMYKAAVCTGPYCTKIQDVMEDLTARGAALIVKNQDDIAAAISALLDNPAALAEKGERAYKVWLEHFGASARIAAKINI